LLSPLTDSTTPSIHPVAPPNRHAHTQTDSKAYTWSMVVMPMTVMTGHIQEDQEYKSRSNSWELILILEIRLVCYLHTPRAPGAG
jgi:hypothetical protein